MKRLRMLEAVVLGAALFMGFALNSCSDEEDWMLADDEFGESQSALSSATITKGAVSVRPPQRLHR